MKFQLKQLLGLSVLSLARTSCSDASIGSGASDAVMNNATMISPNNTILQNLYAWSFNQTASQNSSVSYISLLLGLNTSCTANVTQMLNSSEGNYTFFAPSDQAFRAVPGFPDFGANFCDNCSGNGSGGGNVIIGRIKQNEQQCPRGCNDTSLALNATSSQLMPCLPQILQYHLLNESLTFDSSSYGFLNRSNYNLTVLPSMLNSSCLVNLANSTNKTAGSDNNQVLVFNITNNRSSLANTPEPSQVNVTILHGINAAANVTVFDIQSSNGILHVIDALLIPPANMTDTLISTYSESGSMVNGTNGSSNSTNGSSNRTDTIMLPSFLNQTDLEMYANTTGITVFLPDMNSINSNNNTNTNDTASFNITSYIFPSLLYNNRSFETIGNLTEGVFFQQNLTNLNGDNVTILFGANNAMLFNGSRVTQSNILMKNGVLHLFDNSTNLFGDGSSDSANNTSSDTSSPAAFGLGRILRQYI